MDVKTMLKNARLDKGLTINEAARISNVSASYISRIEKGQRTPSAPILRKLSEVYGFSQNELLRASGFLKEETEKNSEYKVEFIKMPVYDIKRDLMKPLSQDNVINYINMPEEMAGSKCLAVIAPDDSMNSSKIHSGDIILIVRQSNVQEGDIALVHTANSTFIRRYYRTGSIISLMPNSPITKYKPLMFDRNKQPIEILGKVTKALVDI